MEPEPGERMCLSDPGPARGEPGSASPSRGIVTPRSNYLYMAVGLFFFLLLLLFHLLRRDQADAAARL